MATRIDGVALAAIGTGALLTYAGITGKDLPAAVKALIQGKSPTTAPQKYAITGTGGTAGTVPPESQVGQGGSQTANKALGRIMAAAYGWGGSEWQYLESGWQEESGWSTTAANVPSDPYNNAYGIPQANPGTKMASAGADWKTSAYTQIKWGLSYIAQNYGSPSQVPGWTANGPAGGYVGY